jgi:hypothetical protein
MSLKISIPKFVQLMSAGILVMSGLMLKKGGKQAKYPRTAQDIGYGLLIIGWLLVAFVTGVKARKVLLQPLLASLIVLASVIMMVQHTDKKQPAPIVLPFVFSMALFILGWVISKGGKFSQRLGFLGPLLLILSCIVFLPCQRKKKVVDGPGVALHTLGWVFLSVAFSTMN